MTEYIDGIERKSEYSPICLVPYRNHLYYIVDGNHRFAAKKLSNCKSVAAWILFKQDADILEGEPLPEPLAKWKNREITYEQLCRMARQRGVEVYTRRPVDYQADENQTQSHCDNEERSSILLDNKTRQELVEHLVSAIEALGYDVITFENK